MAAMNSFDGAPAKCWVFTQSKTRDKTVGGLLTVYNDQNTLHANYNLTVARGISCIGIKSNLPMKFCIDALRRGWC